MNRYTSLVCSVAFSPNGRFVASAGDMEEFLKQASVRVWEVASGQEIHRLKSHKWPVHSVAFSPDGQLLASADTQGSIRLSDVSGGNEVQQLEASWERISQVHSIAFSPDGHLLAAGGQCH